MLLGFKKVTWTLIAAVTLAVGTVLGAGVQAAHADAVVHYPAAAPAAPALFEICNNASNLLVCMNRQGGGTAEGTPIIGYNPGDPNNDFYWIQEKDLCGGYVTPTCPNLNDPSYNKVWAGSIIVRIWAYDENQCLVDGIINAQNNYTSQMNGCNNIGHSYILVGCKSTSCLGNKFSVVVNIYDMMQAGGTPKCLAWAVKAIPNPLITNDSCSVDAQSNFQEAYF